MDEQQQSDPIQAGSLKNFARYVTEQAADTFTGPLLARYSEAHQLDEQALVRLFGCSEEGLLHLALCGRPRSDQFASDVAHIAAHVHAQVGPLASFYQEVMPEVAVGFAQPTKVYRGAWENDDWQVTVNGQPLPAIGFHCPDGFAWGYDGSACSELALSLLRDYFQEWYVTRAYLMATGHTRSPEPECWHWHLAFKAAFVTPRAQCAGWELTDTEIRAWLQSLRTEASAAGQPASASKEEDHGTQTGSDA